MKLCCRVNPRAKCIHCKEQFCYDCADTKLARAELYDKQMYVGRGPSHQPILGLACIGCDRDRSSQGILTGRIGRVK